MAMLAMFPLGAVLLPGAVMPLHVFEPRYRALVQDCLRAEVPEFGVVMIQRGSEVGGGDQRSSVGTVAQIVQVAAIDDGRYLVVCAGTRRIRVSAWLPDDPYPLADVDDWPDEGPGNEPDVEPDGPALTEQVHQMRARVRRACALANELGDAVLAGTDELSADPVLASYQLAALAPIGPADMYTLLRASGAPARLALLAEVMDDLDARQQFRLAASDDPDFGLPSPQ